MLCRAVGDFEANAGTETRTASEFRGILAMLDSVGTTNLSSGGDLINRCWLCFIGGEDHERERARFYSVVEQD